MLDELTPEVIVVAGGAAVLVLGIMAIVWMVSTREEGSPKRPNAQENAPPTATKPSGKKRKPFSPRKKRDAHRDANSTDEEKDDEEDQPARKSILKIPVESQQDDPVVPNNKSGNHHVGFKMDGSPPRDERSSRPNPPTPHPTTSRKPLSFDAEPLKPNPQPVAKQTETTTATKERKSGGAPSQPKSHSAQKQQTATPASSSGHKKKTRSKQPSTSFDSSSSDELPVSRISAILIASPLSDEDVELLMGKLLEKQESNVEWEAANRSGGSDSVKSLRKVNEELHRRCVDAEQTAQTHSSRIKEIRAEIQQERARRVAVEGSLQAKLTRQNDEITFLKGKVERSQEELKEAKSSEAAEVAKQLESENTSLKSQLSLFAEERATMNAKISSHEKQALSGQETIKDLKAELRRAKDALKTTNSDPHRMDELQTALTQAQQEKDKLLIELKAVNEERGKMRGEMRLLEDAHQEEKKKLEREFSERVVAPVMTEQPVTDAAQEDVDQLKAELAKLKEEGEKQQLQHVEKVETLQAACSRDAEQLRVSKNEQDTLKETVQELEKEKAAKENELTEKLASVEEELKVAKEALLAEQASKKDLQSQTGVLSNGTAETEGSHEKLSADLSKAQEEKQELEEKVKIMQDKLEDLKAKNTTLRDSLWKARDDAATSEKQSQELVKEAKKGTKERITAARDEAIAEQQKCQKEFLERLFPSVEVEEEEDWLSVFEKKVTEEGRRKEQELAEVRSREEEFSQNAENLRTALLSTKGKLDLLQNKCVEREEKLSEQLQETIAAKQELERQLEKETEALRGKLEAVTVNEQQHAATAEETERLAAKNKEQEEELLQVRAKLEEFEEKNEVPIANSTTQLEEEVTQLRAKLAELDSQKEALKSANLELNTRLGSLSPVASTSSEV